MPTAAAPATSAVAQELVNLCRAGRNMEAIERLYAPDVVSVEAVETPAFPAEMRGIDAVARKNEQWAESNEVHVFEVNGPFVGEDQFAVQYTFDTTSKATGQRTQMTEMALYTVKDGKIVREQFFYNMPGM
jgi:ketosteroid isomerase-like protein